MGYHPTSENQRTWQQGHVTCTSMCRVLLRLIIEKDHGFLECKGLQKTMKTIIADTKLVDVQSNYIQGTTLGCYLVQQSKITKEEHSATIKIAKEERIQHGQVLLRVNLLTRDELDTALTRQKIMKFLRLFHREWRGSEYQFERNDEPVSGFPMDPTPLQQLLKNGIMFSAASSDLLGPFIKNNKMGAPIMLSGKFQELAEMLLLSPEEHELAQSIVGMSVEQMKNCSPYDYNQMLRMTFLLIMTHAAHFEKSNASKGDSASPATRPQLTYKPNAQSSRETIQQEYCRQKIDEARFHLKRDAYADAKRILETALQIDPNSSEAYALLAWIHYQTVGIGDPEEAEKAKEMLKEAICKNDRNDEACLFLGRLLKQENMVEMAGPYFKKALALNPNNEEAHREVELLRIRKRQNKLFELH